jgi:hypothetical protein
MKTISLLDGKFTITHDNDEYILHNIEQNAHHTLSNDLIFTAMVRRIEELEEQRIKFIGQYIGQLAESLTEQLDDKMTYFDLIKIQHPEMIDKLKSLL